MKRNGNRETCRLFSKPGQRGWPREWRRRRDSRTQFGARPNANNTSQPFPASPSPLPDLLETQQHLPPLLPPAHLLPHIRQGPRPLLCSGKGSHEGHQGPPMASSSAPSSAWNLISLTFHSLELFPLSFCPQTPSWSMPTFWPFLFPPFPPLCPDFLPFVSPAEHFPRVCLLRSLSSHP